MPFKIRLLLTNACSARCAYCHNEGQSKAKDQISLSSIQHILNAVLETGEGIEEIVLSGGEPTLHPDLPAIAARCQATGATVSMNTHGGHPGKLASALPWLDELKIHVDSFDPQRQRQSMGIEIAPVLRSIELAKRQPHLRIAINHPLHAIDEACAVISEARWLNVNCKLIELLGAAGDRPRLQHMPWSDLGYQSIATGLWRHGRSNHHVMTRRCTDGTAHAELSNLFVGPEGLRRGLETALIPLDEALATQALAAWKTPASPSKPLTFHRYARQTTASLAPSK